MTYLAMILAVVVLFPIALIVRAFILGFIREMHKS